MGRGDSIFTLAPCHAPWSRKPFTLLNGKSYPNMPYVPHHPLCGINIFLRYAKWNMFTPNISFRSTLYTYRLMKGERRVFSSHYITSSSSSSRNSYLHDIWSSSKWLCRMENENSIRFHASSDLPEPHFQSNHRSSGKGCKMPRKKLLIINR